MLRYTPPAAPAPIPAVFAAERIHADDTTVPVLAKGKTQTGLHVFVAFAKPFRMPDFFLISGLFLPLVIDRNWRLYLNRKVAHFAYFYVLWVDFSTIPRAASSCVKPIFNTMR